MCPSIKYQYHLTSSFRHCSNITSLHMSVGMIGTLKLLIFILWRWSLVYSTDNIYFIYCSILFLYTFIFSLLLHFWTSTAIFTRHSIIVIIKQDLDFKPKDFPKLILFCKVIKSKRVKSPFSYSYLYLIQNNLKDYLICPINSPNRLRIHFEGT